MDSHPARPTPSRRTQALVFWSLVVVALAVVLMRAAVPHASSSESRAADIAEIGANLHASRTNLEASATQVAILGGAATPLPTR